MCPASAADELVTGEVHGVGVVLAEEARSSFLLLRLSLMSSHPTWSTAVPTNLVITSGLLMILKATGTYFRSEVPLSHSVTMGMDDLFYSCLFHHTSFLAASTKTMMAPDSLLVAITASVSQSGASLSVSF